MRKILLGFLALLVLGLLGLFLVLPGVNLAGFVAPRLQAALGRPVAIERLTLTPGAWARLDATGIVLGAPANPPGRIRTVTAEVALGSLLSGPPRLRHVLVEDAAIDLTPLLRGNPGGGGPAAGAPDLPQVADATLRRVDLTWPGDGGPQRGHIEELTLAAPDAEGRLHAAGRGAFAGQPFALDGGTEAMPQAGQPARATLGVSLGPNRASFAGTIADPLALDGIDGALTLAVPSLPAVAKVLGLPTEGMDGGLAVQGRLLRQGGAWALEQVTGDLAGAKLTAPKLAFRPGAAGKPPGFDLDLDLADVQVDRLYAGLGRGMTIKRLKLSPGAWIGVQAEGVAIANIPGGSQPQMFTLGKLVGELDPQSLGAGPPTLRKVAVEKLFLLLEKDKQNHRDWRFGKRADDTAPAPVNAPPDDRSGLPLLLDATLRDGEVIIRTTSGKPLVLKIGDAHWTTPGLDQKVKLTGKGSWQGAPITLDGTLDPVAVLRQTAKPYPAVLKLGSGKTTLDFTGTFTDPLNVEGAKGKLHVRAPGPEDLLALGGIRRAAIDAALEVVGDFEHHGNQWVLSHGTGTLSGSPLKIARLDYREGQPGKADAVAFDIEAGRLDLNRLLQDGGKGGGGDDADLPLHMDPNPDPAIEAKLRVGELAFNKMRARAVHLDGALQPNRIIVRDLGLTAYSARVTAKAEATPAGGGARVQADVVLHEGEVEALRQAFGLRNIPVTGRLKGEVVVAAQGHHVVQALSGSDISAVVALQNGTIPREVMQYASQNLGALFNKSGGVTPVSCLLAVANMRAGVGEVAPLRLRSADGTLAGLVTFDLWRKQMDIVIGTDSKTTGSLALDIPVRIAGSFADPVIRPATWSADGRAKLAASNSVARVPPALRREAQQNACFSGR